jgi:hypothetical protein
MTMGIGNKQDGTPYFSTPHIVGDGLNRPFKGRPLANNCPSGLRRWLKENLGVELTSVMAGEGCISGVQEASGAADWRRLHE